MSHDHHDHEHLSEQKPERKVCGYNDNATYARKTDRIVNMILVLFIIIWLAIGGLIAYAVPN